MTPIERLNQFNKANAETKDVYKKMQAWQVKNKPENGIFCPMYEISYQSPRLFLELSKLKDQRINQMTYASYKYANELQVFGTWRNSLGIYKIDDDIIKSVADSQIPDDTPVNIFERLPEWCVYFDTSALDLSEKDGENEYKIVGFWALFDLVLIGKTYQRTLKLMINVTGADEIAPLIDLPVDSDMSIAQSIKHFYASEPHADPFVSAKHAQSDIEMLKILLSMLLWLCAEEPDISNIVGEPIYKDTLRLPKYRVNKKTGAFIPPDRPTFYELGRRLGGEIRQFNEQIGSVDERISARKRPHIRRGHWHGVWSGTGQNKQFRIYWQPAIFVNAN